MNETSPAPSLTFMQAWGQLVWMTIIISAIGTILWYSVGTLSAAAVTVMLVCLEMVMFLMHVCKNHAHQGHPLVRWFVGDRDSALVSAVLSMAAGFIWVGLVATWMTFHAERYALSVTMLGIGQACLSESIHRIAHKDTAFHHRRLTTWMEPTFYAGAILGVIGGLWLIGQ